MEIINSMSSKSFLIIFLKVVLIKTFASSRDLFKKLLNFNVHVFFRKETFILQRLVESYCTVYC